jgi:hypothetical protein
MTVVLNTSDYNQKIVAILGAPTYWRLLKNQTEAMEQKTTLLVQRI